MVYFSLHLSSRRERTVKSAKKAEMLILRNVEMRMEGVGSEDLTFLGCKSRAWPELKLNLLCLIRMSCQQGIVLLGTSRGGGTGGAFFYPPLVASEINAQTQIGSPSHAQIYQIYNTLINLLFSSKDFCLQL